MVNPDQPKPLQAPAAGLPVVPMNAKVPPLLDVVADKTFGPSVTVVRSESKCHTARFVRDAQVEGPPVGPELMVSVSVPVLPVSMDEFMKR